MHIFNDFENAKKFINQKFPSLLRRNQSKTWGIIPAAGFGRRFADKTPKQYHKIHGLTVLERSISALLSVPTEANLACVIVVLAVTDEFCRDLDYVLSGNIVKSTIPVFGIRCGGDTRKLSVRAGLDFLKDSALDSNWVLVHDGARPFVSKAALARLWKVGICENDGAILALPVSDTLKTKNEERSNVKNLCGYVKETVKREKYWLAQTPQMFKYGDLCLATNKENDNFTDESSAIESLGKEPALVMGEKKNIKITVKEDLFAGSYGTSDDKKKMSDRDMLLIGQGFDVHRFGGIDNFVMIGGVKVPNVVGLEAHSDGDVLLHAICDGIIGAAGLGDIGDWFSDKDPSNRGLNSRVFLKKIISTINKKSLFVYQIDATVICEVPKISPYKNQIEKLIRNDTNCSHVNIKASTTERLGFTGRKEGIAALSVVSLCRVYE